MEKIFSQTASMRFLDQYGYQFLGNSPSRWLFALLAGMLTLALLVGARRLVIGRLRALAERTTTQLDDLLLEIIQRTGSLYFFILSFYVASRSLVMGSYGVYAQRLLVIATFIQIAFWATALLNGVLRRWSHRADRPANATAVIAFRFIGRVIIWSLCLLLMLDNLGVKVVSLMAGLGVGGIAVALAVQNILGDLFSSISIVLDKPFEIGDTISVGDCTGAVEHIGLKTTRLRSVTGEQLILSNSDLLGSRIRNFKRMNERRVLLTFGVSYQTPAELLPVIPGLLREAVQSQANIRFDRAHLSKLAPYSIDFEMVYWVTVPDYMAHMDAQQALLLQVASSFAGRGIEFAYPTQTVLVQGNAKA